MKRPQHIVFWIFFVFFLLSLAAGVCELFGASVCLFGVPLHGRLLLPICISFTGVTVCAVRALHGRCKNAENPLLYRVLSVALSVFCAVLLLVSLPVGALTSTSYADSRLSNDRAYKIFLEESADSAEPIAHVYKRYTPFLVVYRNSAVLYGFSGSLSDITVEWADTVCAVQYPGYSDEAESTEDLQRLSRKIPYSSP